MELFRKTIHNELQAVLGQVTIVESVLGLAHDYSYETLSIDIPCQRYQSRVYAQHMIHKVVKCFKTIPVKEPTRYYWPRSDLNQDAFQWIATGDSPRADRLVVDITVWARWE